MIPFQYPDTHHVRRHGPAGYANYESYRPWLRDEFTFRCAYCLKRERWGTLRGEYHIDHLMPQAHHPDSVVDYDNLIYSCASCNSAKGDTYIPDPSNCMISGDVEVHDDGRIVPKTPDARKVVRTLGLDDPEYQEYRQLLIGIVAMANNTDSDEYKRLMQYPEALPNLKRLRPKQNKRPEGIKKSYYALRERGKLPETY